jgi:hypothetical protein
MSGADASMRAAVAATSFAILGAFAVAGSTACERSPGCLDDCPPAPRPASPDRGPVTVTVDPSMALGPVVTGGGTNFTGFASYLAPGNARTDLLAQMPYKLNRIHFSGEVPDPATFTTQDRLDSHLPQSGPPPAPWNFQWLDGVVAVARAVRDAGGPDFILTIHNAPQWMTLHADVQGYPPQNPQDYATYCARLVAYYNQGSFVDDGGRTVANPAGVVGIKYWEIWNEPNINDVGQQDTAVMTPASYASLFATVTAAMRAVDPSIQLGGPNTVSDQGDSLQYIDALLSSGAKVDFVAVHQYQAETSMPDQMAFQVAAPLKDRPHTKLPIVISESNSDSSDQQTRTGSAFEWAAMPFEYKAHVEAGTWRVLRWETYEHDYDLVDAVHGQPRTTYWVERAFWSAVPEGGTRVPCSSSSADIACLATLTPDQKLDVVLIDIGVVDASDNNGVGVRHQVSVSVADGASRTFSIQSVDRDTDPRNGPVTTQGAGAGVVIDGYGIATLQQQ